MTLAHKAVEEFKTTRRVPNYGQRILDGVGPGAVHVFPDGSVAAHWDDGDFTEAELQEE